MLLSLILKYLLILLNTRSKIFLIFYSYLKNITAYFMPAALPVTKNTDEQDVTPSWWFFSLSPLSYDVPEDKDMYLSLWTPRA